MNDGDSDDEAAVKHTTGIVPVLHTTGLVYWFDIISLIHSYQIFYTLTMPTRPFVIHYLVYVQPIY